MGTVHQLRPDRRPPPTSSPPGLEEPEATRARLNREERALNWSVAAVLAVFGLLLIVAALAGLYLRSGAAQ